MSADAGSARRVLFRSRSHHRGDVVEVEARQPVEPRVRARLADIDDDERLVTAIGKELMADGVGVESGHRSGGETRGPDAEDEVADLECGVETDRKSGV